MPATAVRKGLQTVEVGPHKIQTVLERMGISWVDDSKATNPHAADAALRLAPWWIAGGQAKGTTFDELVAAHRRRLRGAVLLGADRKIIAQALARHAPEVPTQIIEAVDTRAMAQAVAAAASWPDLVMLSCSRRGAPVRTCSPITPHAGMPSLPRCVRSQKSRHQWRP